MICTSLRRVIPCQVNANKMMTPSDLDETWFLSSIYRDTSNKKTFEQDVGIPERQKIKKQGRDDRTKQ